MVSSLIVVKKKETMIKKKKIIIKRGEKLIMKIRTEINPPGNDWKGLNYMYK